jgi:hypothetical protein
LEQLNDSNCEHTEQERALTGTWVSLEIDKALEIGYKLIKYHSIWHFENKIQYDPVSKKGGLFTEYVNFNLKGKTEASGFPNNCTTDLQKEKFIKEFHDKEGILLEKDKCIKNPGQRNERKKTLYCLRGFFALASDKTLFKIIYKKKN